MNSEFKIMFTPSTEGFMSYLHPYRNSRSGSHFTILTFDKILISFLSESVLNHSLTSQTGLLVGRGKKVKFRGIFRGKFVEKTADFVGISREFSGPVSLKNDW